MEFSEETKAAIKEVAEGKIKVFSSIEDLFKDLNDDDKNTASKDQN